jgi:hypothetical protein
LRIRAERLQSLAEMLATSAALARRTSAPAVSVIGHMGAVGEPT